MRLLLILMLVAACSATAPAFADELIQFTGCKTSFGNAPDGAFPEPAGSSKTVDVSKNAAKQLAYYASSAGPALVGPKGWFCQVTGGSQHVSMEIDSDDVDDSGVPYSISFGANTGEEWSKLETAEILVKYFPRFPRDPDFIRREKAFARKQKVEFKAETEFDNLKPTYANDHTIEYKGRFGEGGVLMLSGVTDKNFVGIARLSVYLPRELEGLRATIENHFEKCSDFILKNLDECSNMPTVR